MMKGLSGSSNAVPTAMSSLLWKPPFQCFPKIGQLGTKLGLRDSTKYVPKVAFPPPYPEAKAQLSLPRIHLHCP